jgi:hypothetical protein
MTLDCILQEGFFYLKIKPSNKFLPEGLQRRVDGEGVVARQ